MNHHVKIGPSFFAKVFNDYSSWTWAFVREALQNGIDAPGSTEVRFEVQSGTDTTIAFQNDGSPMTEEELVGKFLALGESGKNFQGTIGGMGRAKELLCL